MKIHVNTLKLERVCGKCPTAGKRNTNIHLSAARYQNINTDALSAWLNVMLTETLLDPGFYTQKPRSTSDKLRNTYCASDEKHSTEESINPPCSFTHHIIICTSTDYTVLSVSQSHLNYSPGRKVTLIHNSTIITSSTVQRYQWPTLVSQNCMAIFFLLIMLILFLRFC